MFFVPFDGPTKFVVFRRPCVPQLWRYCEKRRKSHACPNHPVTCEIAWRTPVGKKERVKYLKILQKTCDNCEIICFGISVYLTTEESHGASIDPCEIRSSCHRLQVILTFLRMDMSARQLPVVRLDVVAFHRFLHLH